MADVTRRRTGEMLRKLFEMLMGQPDGMQAKDALAALASSMQLTPYEAGNYSAGGRRFERIVRFATVDTVKAGWLLKSKGRWFVTDAGRKAFAQYLDPESFYKEACRLYHQWRTSNPPTDAGTDAVDTEGAGDVAGREVTQTFEEAEERAWVEVEQYLKQMPPYEFQDMVGALLVAMGYHVSWTAPPGKDGGIDILAFSDPLGTRPPRIKVQVKRHQQTVSVDGLRSFLAVLGDEDVGIFVNTGGFTKDAQDEARTQPKRKITLVDLERLYDLWVEYYGKLDEKGRRFLPLRPIYFLAPES